MKKNERTEEEYRNAAKNAFSFAGMCRNLGLGPFGANYRRVHKAVEKYSIDISHFTGQGWNVGHIFNPTSKVKQNIDDILVENSTYDNSNNLRLRLLNEGLKEHRCERCKNTEWEGEPIPLQLHHVNGIRNDNRIENLQLLCPNCHALTDNYCGKNKDSVKKDLRKSIEEVYGDADIKNIFAVGGKKRVNEPKYCPVCGSRLKDTRNKYCSAKCAAKAQTKLPSDEVIKEHILCGMSNSEIAKIYGVSESAVRHRLKKMDI